MVQIREYTWAEFDDDICKLSNKIKHLSIKRIYGNPRGGLPVAVALSHKTDIPITMFANETTGVLWVDDIVDSGKQLNKAKEFNYLEYCCLLSRDTTQAICSQVIKNNDWIVFPWEDKNKAKEDYESWLCQ